MAEYPKTATNKLGRLANRGKYDHATIHNLINACPILHVSFTDPAQPFPVTLPMLGCMGHYSPPDADASQQDDNEDQFIYLHGYISARLFRTAHALPLTVSATFLDGLVLSLAPFHNSCNYRSAVAYGYAELVDDRAEALYAMREITENMLPGRWEGSRGPPTEAEVKSTGVVRVRVEAGEFFRTFMHTLYLISFRVMSSNVRLLASAKIRTGGPSEDRKDLQDKQLVSKTWTGVVPYWGTWGEPVEAAENGCKEVEGYIEKWRVGETGRARAQAFEAVTK
ncbi:5-nitroimidazole antibiotic resistance protein [Phaeosphaeria sp. MPI-PUGE-AT-0046c]|nr:5-nitroimidazole antibiotic resistance protein [Phaeosphaeria sp. MPI-PUGE-AT-0046c]